MNRKNLTQDIILLLISIAATFLVAEILLRSFMPLEARRNRYMRTRDIFQYDRKNVIFDEELGYIARPDLKVPFNNEEFNTTITTNSAGFRDTEGSLKDPEVLILGDSLGFGWGVNGHETCGKYLEKISGLRTLNMSISGYGTLQEFLLLRRWSQGHDISGKTAVFLIYPNDIIDNMGDGLGVHPSALSEAGTIKFSKPSQKGIEDLFRMYETDSYRRPIYRSSYVAYLYKGFAKDIKNKIKARRHSSGSGENAPQALPPDQDLKYMMFDGLIREIMVFAKEKNLKTLFVWIPSVKRFEDDSAVFGGDKEDKVFGKVKEAVGRSSALFLDAGEVLTRDDYYRYDGHLKPSGNYKLAGTIARAISK